MTAEQSAAVSTVGLERRFGDRLVLRDVSLTIRAGDVFVLLGKNGSGKTTLLEILATLLHPTAGRAAVLGHDVVREGGAVRSAIGYAPSSLHSFYPRLTGMQNLEFFGTVYGVERKRLRDRARLLMDQLSLGPAGRVRVERYSDGMKGRLSIARALLTDAPVLLLDEPTKSLDAEGRDAARRLIVGEGRRARTIVWVTHDEGEASAIATRVAVLENGTVQ